MTEDGLRARPVRHARRLVFQLAEVTEGTTLRVGPGGVCLVEDQVDHTFTVVGPEPRVFIIARLAQ